MIDIVFAVVDSLGVLYLASEYRGMSTLKKLEPYLRDREEERTRGLETWFTETYGADDLATELFPEGASKPDVSTEGPRAGERLYNRVAGLVGSRGAGKTITAVSTAFSDVMKSGRSQYNHGGAFVIVKNGEHIYRKYQDGRLVLVRNNAADSPDTSSGYHGPYRYPNV